MNHKYSVEILNISTNKWEIFNLARTLDEAFDITENAIGYSKDYDTVAILDPQGFVLWESSGFRQGAGRKLPTLEEIKNANL